MGMQSTWNGNWNIADISSSRKVFATFALVSLCVAFGFLVVVEPRSAVIPIIPIMLVMIITSPLFRLAFVTFGGILTLQSLAGFNAPKVLYFLGCFMCISLVIVAFFRTSPDENRSRLQPIFRWLPVWSFVVLVSFFVAVRNSIPLLDWFRGAVPYVLFAAVPLVVFDITKRQATMRDYRIVRLCFVIAGLLTAFSWFVSWISSRGYAQLGIDRLFLWSLVLSLALLCYAVSAAYHSDQRRGLWLLLALLIFLLFALTGTRQALLFLVAPIALMFQKEKATARKTLKFTLLIVPALGISLLVALILVRYLHIDTTAIFDRFSNLGGITNHSVEGRSYQERLVQTSLAREAFISNIWIGVSPGHKYEWLTEFGKLKQSFNIDSPLALLANFGLLGLAAATFTWFQIPKFTKLLKSPSDSALIETDALRIFSLTLVVYVLAGSPFEDKGLSFAFMFLLSLALLRSQIGANALHDGTRSTKNYQEWSADENLNASRFPTEIRLPYAGTKS